MLFEGRDMVIEAFKNHIFRFFEKAEELESDSESDSKFEECFLFQEKKSN